MNALPVTPAKAAVRKSCGRTRSSPPRKAGALSEGEHSGFANWHGKRAGPTLAPRCPRSRANLRSRSRSAVGGYAVSVKGEPIEEHKESGVIPDLTGRGQRLNKRILQSKTT